MEFVILKKSQAQRNSSFKPSLKFRNHNLEIWLVVNLISTVVIPGLFSELLINVNFIIKAIKNSQLTTTIR